MIFADHPLTASALSALGLLFVLFSFWHSEHQLLKAPTSWKLRKLPDDDIDHAEFDIFGYVQGWTERGKLGKEFSHVGFGSTPSFGFSYFRVVYLNTPLYMKSPQFTDPKYVSEVGLKIYSLPMYFKQLHMRQIPTTIKTCGRFTRVRIAGRILKNLEPLSCADFNNANTNSWGQDNFCPCVVIDSVQIEPCLFSLLRMAWLTMPP